MPRQRLRPTRRLTGAAQAAPQSSVEPRGASRAWSKPKWRRTIESFGGFTTIGAIVGAIVVVGAIFISNRPASTSPASDDPLLGRAVEASDSETGNPHVTDTAQLQIPEGEPPTRGPMFNQPQQAGVYEQAVPDGNTIHSLEHGIVWLSYNPGLVDEDMIKKAEELGKQYGSDLIVSPRPDNASPIAIVSWGRLLELDIFDQLQLENFVKTNTNRSPEAGMR